MSAVDLRPTHKPVQTNYTVPRQFDDPGVSHGDALRSAFWPARLLRGYHD
jgi:hypothetical protein